MINFIKIGFIVVLSLSFLFFLFPNELSFPKNEIRIGNTTLLVEIAKTPKEKTVGLSGRMSLQENSGMLFIFDEPGIYGFWMKDMHFPIDIIWLDENKKIIGITENILPETFPKTFYPPSSALYVLEINANLANKLEITLGDVVEFSF